MIIKASFEYITDDEIESYISKRHDNIVFTEPALPCRATSDSAGYDINTPMAIDLQPGEETIVPTFLKCYIPEGWFLALYPKSGLGWKYFVRIANTTGIIDGDYYNNADNEGHIMVKIRNEGDKPLHIDQGRGFVQAIFQPYGVCWDEHPPVKIRSGGFGSTNA